MRNRRLRITPLVLMLLGMDVLGMFLFAAGAVFLANGQALMGRFPTRPVEAALLLVAGAVFMLVAAANLLRETLQQPESTARPGGDQEQR